MAFPSFGRMQGNAVPYPEETPFGDAVLAPWDWPRQSIAVLGRRR